MIGATLLLASVVGAESSFLAATGCAVFTPLLPSCATVAEAGLVEEVVGPVAEAGLGEEDGLGPVVGAEVGLVAEASLGIVGKDSLACSVAEVEVKEVEVEEEVEEEVVAEEVEGSGLDTDDCPEISLALPLPSTVGGAVRLSTVGGAGTAGGIGGKDAVVQPLLSRRGVQSCGADSATKSLTVEGGGNYTSPHPSQPHPYHTHHTLSTTPPSHPYHHHTTITSLSPPHTPIITTYHHIPITPLSLPTHITYPVWLQWSSHVPPFGS